MKKNQYGLEPKVYARLYANWQNIKRRCLNTNDKEYKNYGGRGITICDEWKNDFHKYAQWAVSNGWKDGLSIERVDVDKGYSPENCTFIPKREQCYNKTDTAWISNGQVTKSLAKWCEEFGISKYTASTRRNRDGITNFDELFAKPKSLKKAILQINLNGDIVGEYDSITEAAKLNGFNRRNINNALSGYAKTAHNYIWEYKGGQHPCSNYQP